MRAYIHINIYDYMLILFIFLCFDLLRLKKMKLSKRKL